MFRPNDPLYHYQWNLQKIGMERTWDVNRGAKAPIIVADHRHRRGVPGQGRSLRPRN